MYDVYCISAGQTYPKKNRFGYSRKQLYLNYGLLSLASIIEANGFSTIQLQGNFTAPKEFLEYCIRRNIHKTTQPIFISIVSFYALAWTREFIKLLKATIPSATIILGGRWVINGRPDLLKKEIPAADIIIDGLGESQILSHLNYGKFHKVADPFTNVYTPLNYQLLDNRELYQPSIEVSRGCGMKCSFCQEGEHKLLPLKSVTTLFDELRDTMLQDHLTPMSPYFEASLFRPTLQWAEELSHHYVSHNMPFHWRAESRVDTMSPKILSTLVKGGLTVLDLGLESASHSQLKRMGKTQTPERYLEKASQLLHVARECGVHVKVNILLYAGESDATINETYTWLDAHRHCIKGISVGPVFAFGWDDKKTSFINELAANGASVDSERSQLGISAMNLSSTISHADSLQIASDLTSEFMSTEDYFYLKSFSYFPRNYTFDQFLLDNKPIELI